MLAFSMLTQNQPSHSFRQVHMKKPPFQSFEMTALLFLLRANLVRNVFSSNRARHDGDGVGHIDFFRINHSGTLTQSLDVDAVGDFKDVWHVVTD